MATPVIDIDFEIMTARGLTPEQLLWFAVIHRAFLDFKYATIHKLTRQAQAIMRQVRDEWFMEICENAGVDGARVRDYFEQKYSTYLEDEKWTNLQ